MQILPQDSHETLRIQETSCVDAARELGALVPAESINSLEPASGSAALGPYSDAIQDFLRHLEGHTPLQQPSSL